MKIIDDSSLRKVKGGFDVSIVVALGIAIACVFISGFLQGITNPERCGSSE